MSEYYNNTIQNHSSERATPHKSPLCAADKYEWGGRESTSEGGRGSGAVCYREENVVVPALSRKSGSAAPLLVSSNARYAR